MLLLLFDISMLQAACCVLCEYDSYASTQMAHTYRLILPDWGFSLADINTDIYVATASNDPVHHRSFAEYIGRLNPRARVHVAINGGRTFALTHLRESLAAALQLPLSGDAAIDVVSRDSDS